VLANDSGVSHLAAAVGAPQVTLIGVTDPARTGPWSPRAVCAGKLGHWPTVNEALSAVERALHQ
jgi:heptosyltransferase II